MNEKLSSFALCLVTVTLLFPTLTQAQRVASQDDIQATVDKNWPQVSAGGYFPVMLAIENRGPDCNLRISVSSDPGFSLGRVPVVEKRISLARNAKTQTILSVPVVSLADDVMLRIEKNGRELDSLSTGLAIAGDLYSYAFVVIDSIAPNVERLREFFLDKTTASTRPYSAPDISVVRRSPTDLPDSWLAYSGLDAVFVEANSLVEMREATRNELFRWVSAGGMLIVYDTDQLADGINKLDQLHGGKIRPESWGSLKDNWVLQKQDGAEVPLSFEIQFREYHFGTILAMPSDPFTFGSVATNGFWHNGDRAGRGANTRTSQTLISADSDASPVWQFIFNNSGLSYSRWSDKQGFSPRVISGEFMQFLNTHISRLPTWAFVTLITIFSILIGPVNYLYLRSRNKVGQMLWTTPLIAIVTSLVLFVWSSLANGSDIHVRSRSVSILDQASQSMVSRHRMAAFFGATPSGGLRFEPGSAVYPIWQEGNEFERGTVDWTESQVMNGSFCQGNSRSQFMITTPRTERGRIKIVDSTDSELKIGNGLEWELSHFLFRDNDGRFFYGTNIGAGNSATLHPASREDFREIQNRLDSQLLRAPGGAPPRSGWDYYGAVEQIDHSNIRGSIYEQKLSAYNDYCSAEIARLRNKGLRPSGFPTETFFSVLAEAPSLDTGMTEFETSEELHVLIGNLGDE